MQVKPRFGKGLGRSVVSILLCESTVDGCSDREPHDGRRWDDVLGIILHEDGHAT